MSTMPRATSTYTDPAIRPLIVCSRTAVSTPRSAGAAARLELLRVEDPALAVGAPLGHVHRRMRLALGVELDAADHAFVLDGGERVADRGAFELAGLLHGGDGELQAVVGLGGEAVRLLAVLLAVALAEGADARYVGVRRKGVVLHHAFQARGVEPLEEAVRAHGQGTDELGLQPGVADLLDGEAAGLLVHEQHDRARVGSADVGNVAREVHFADVEVA